jgi:CRISPR-associated protein Cas1
MNVQMNTLFVTAEGAYLHKDHATVMVKVNGETRAQVPLVHLASVVCFGRVSVSPDLMAALSEAGAHVAFFSTTGRFLARVEGMPGGNVLLRRQQFRAADDAARSLSIARAIVIGKVANTRAFLMHARRDAAPERKDALAEACDRLTVHLRALPRAESVDVVRGLEGAAAAVYFGVFDSLIKREEDALRFSGRSRRPPKDRVNALLSFGYALLMQDCAGAAAGVGLDPAVGYLHEERPGRLSLALDLMEELRAPVVDRLMVSLLNRGQVSAGDFVEEPGGGFRLKDEARRTVLVAYQEAKVTEVRHLFLDQSITWGRVPHLQALLLARAVRGDLDAYPPFSIR